MRYLLVALLLFGCSVRDRADHVFEWKDMKESPRKESCRRCSIDADIKDCNKCVYNK